MTTADPGARRLSLRRPADGVESPAPGPQRGALARPSQWLVRLRDPQDPHSEQVRALRTELLLRHDGDGGANMVALLSPQAGEGRSWLAAQLAVAFAQFGRPTLLVDADLRRPTQHLVFAADNRHGLSQGLAGGAAPVAQPVEGCPALSLLTAGPAPSNPLELLWDPRFGAMVESWRSGYAFVVIDTPPVAPYSDALAVAARVGRVLLLSRAHHTPYRATRELLQRLAAAQARVLGAVLNRF